MWVRKKNTDCDSDVQRPIKSPLLPRVHYHLLRLVVVVLPAVGCVVPASDASYDLDKWTDPGFFSPS